MNSSAQRILSFCFELCSLVFSYYRAADSNFDLCSLVFTEDLGLKLKAGGV
jgi:hypothetical protein